MLQVIVNGKAHPVADLNEASALVDRTRGQLGGKAWDRKNPGGARVVDSAGVEAARVSYNARAWLPDGTEHRVGSRETAAEMQARWAAERGEADR